MADIQYATAEIRRGKKKRKKPHGKTRWLYCVKCHNTVLGEEALLIYIVPACYVKNGKT